MGCMCSIPSIANFERRDYSKKSINSTFPSSKSMFRRRHLEREGVNRQHNMAIAEILDRSISSVDDWFPDSLDPIMVAAVVVMESAGVADLKTFREDFQEHAYGMGQMLFSTAQFLVDSGYSKFVLEKPEDLLNPTKALYFVCAYLDYLTKHEKTSRNEEFIVKGYHNGSLRMEEAPTEVWDVYIKAKNQMLNLAEALKSPDAEEIIHVVQPGENVDIISRICDVSVEAIVEANPDIKDPNSVQPGDCIEIPVKRLLPRLYAVKAGDSISSIAKRHDISLYRLLNANPDIKNPSTLKPGWLLSIPGLKGMFTDSKAKNDLIAAGVDDNPFLPSSPVDDDEQLPDRRDEMRSSPSRIAMRKLLSSHKRSSPK